MNNQFFNPNGFKNIWVTSDLHFSHKNIIKGVSSWDDKSGCRDFQSITEHDQYIINRINTVVDRQDVLIHLGDFSFGGKENLIRARESINCSTVVSLFGNHTECLHKDEELQKLFQWNGWYNEFYKSKVLFCQFHFPCISWNEKQKGSIMLSGHEHNKLIYENRQLDCCIEGNSYVPYHLDQIYDMMMKRPITGQGHHVVGER